MTWSIGRNLGERKKRAQEKVNLLGGDRVGLLLANACFAKSGRDVEAFFLLAVCADRPARTGPGCGGERLERQ